MLPVRYSLHTATSTVMPVSHMMAAVRVSMGSSASSSSSPSSTAGVQAKDRAYTQCVCVSSVESGNQGVRNLCSDNIQVQNIVVRYRSNQWLTNHTRNTPVVPGVVAHEPRPPMYFCLSTHMGQPSVTRVCHPGVSPHSPVVEGAMMNSAWVPSWK
jgi:hypothetical protein